MPRPRYSELDILRTIAIVSMVCWHLLFDLHHFYEGAIDPDTGMLKLVGRGTAALFLLLVGMSFAASAGNAPVPWKKTLRRFAVVGGCALLITIVTYIMDPGTFIRFGILHCIAVTGLVLPFARRLKEWNLPAGAALIAAGIALKGTIVDTALLIPFGLIPPAFRTLDFYPLLPWGGVMLTGLGLGHLLYVRQWRPVPMKSLSRLLKLLSVPGRYSLLIYMAHQPILLALLRLWISR